MTPRRGATCAVPIEYPLRADHLGLDLDLKDLQAERNGTWDDYIKRIDSHFE